jgi:hypothetical protein
VGSDARQQNQFISVKRLDHEHNLAKVGVEGSNPFARARFIVINQSVETGLSDHFCLHAQPVGRQCKLVVSTRMHETGHDRGCGCASAVIFGLSYARVFRSIDGELMVLPGQRAKTAQLPEEPPRYRLPAAQIACAFDAFPTSVPAGRRFRARARQMRRQAVAE